MLDDYWIEFQWGRLVEYTLGVLMLLCLCPLYLPPYWGMVVNKDNEKLDRKRKQNKAWQIWYQKEEETSLELNWITLFGQIEQGRITTSSSHMYTYYKVYIHKTGSCVYLMALTIMPFYGREISLSLLILIKSGRQNQISFKRHKILLYKKRNWTRRKLIHKALKIVLVVAFLSRLTRLMHNAHQL